MKVVDPYEVLGVPRDASREDVRKAYRKMAKQAHPDGGGSRERFALVTLAHDALSDDRRRKHFDETGELEDKPVDLADAMAMTIAMNAIDGVLEQIARIGGRPQQFQVLKDARINLDTLVSQTNQKLDQMKNEAEKQRKLAKRFTSKKGKPNKFSPMFVARADQIERDMGRGRLERDNIEAAIRLLVEHDFESENF
jgi:curved DNA-binding protein CbpA